MAMNFLESLQGSLFAIKDEDKIKEEINSFTSEYTKSIFKIYGDTGYQQYISGHLVNLNSDLSTYRMLSGLKDEIMRPPFLITVSINSHLPNHIKTDLEKIKSLYSDHNATLLNSVLKAMEYVKSSNVESGAKVAPLAKLSNERLMQTIIQIGAVREKYKLPNDELNKLIGLDKINSNDKSSNTKTKVTNPTQQQKSKPKSKDQEKAQPKKDQTPSVSDTNMDNGPAKDASDKAAKEKADVLQLALKDAGAKSGQTGGGGGGGRSPESTATYGAIANKLIKQNWRFPQSPDLKLVCVVELQVAPDGRIQSSRITQSSGQPDFDSSALRAVRDTGDLPQPPGSIRHLEFTFNSQERR
jgi:TonB family protein